MTWLSIIVAGILTYFTRMTMVALVSRDMLGDKIKAVLAYVPSAVFPAIIFPGIFINDYGQFIEMDDPCLLYTSPSPRDRTRSRMPSSA